MNLGIKVLYTAVFMAMTAISAYWIGYETASIKWELEEEKNIINSNSLINTHNSTIRIMKVKHNTTIEKMRKNYIREKINVISNKDINYTNCSVSDDRLHKLNCAINPDKCS